MVFWERDKSNHRVSSFTHVPIILKPLGRDLKMSVILTDPLFSSPLIPLTAPLLTSILRYPIMIGVLQISTPLRQWKVIYLLWGAFTMAAGLAFYMIVGDSPATAWFLNDRQRFVVSAHLSLP